MISLQRAVGALVLTMGLGTAAHASLITGTPIGGSNFSPASTNADNYQLSLDGTNRPHVLLDTANEGSVVLDFYNLAAGLAFFEIRIDGVQTGATAHPVIPGDTIHTGGVGVASGQTSLDRTFNAIQYVDVRLALGGESDYRFDWVRFDVAPAEIPLPGTLALAGLSLFGLAAARRRTR